MGFSIKICSLKFPGTCPGWRNLAIDDENGNPKEILACCNRDAARECKHGYIATITSETLEWEAK